MNLFHSTSNNEDYEQEVNERIAEYKKKRHMFKNNNLKFLEFMPRDYLSDDECILNVLKYHYYWFEYLKLKPTDIVLAFDNNFDKKTFSQKELDNLKILSDEFNKIGVTIGVYDYRDVYTYKQVKNADKKIKEIANKINSKNLSPLEKLMYAYLEISNREYIEEDEKDSGAKSRSVYGVLNSDKIVCAGYAELLRAIVLECKDDNLKCFINTVGLKRKKGYGLHANNIVYLNDTKHKINGFYYLDPTWENNFENSSKSLNYFMIEIGQIDSIWRVITTHKHALRMLKRKDEHDKSDKNFSKVMKYGENLINIGYPKDVSVSRNKADFENTFHFRDKVTKKNKDLFLDFYLLSRNDFKDFIALEQTKKDCNKDNDNFEKIFTKNYFKAHKDASKLPVFKSKKIMWEYLNEHSAHIDVGQIENALTNVLKSKNPKITKDELSKKVYDMLSFNIKESKSNFTDGSTTAFSECEEKF